MNTSRSTSSAGFRQIASSAFTLLELLVVISIIAVLAGILLPVAGSVMETARKTAAKNTVSQIVTAVKAFQTDYGVYPVVPGTAAANPPVDTTFDGTTNQNLFNILRATGVGSDVVASSPNTRRIPYFEGKDVKNVNVPKDGFIPLNAAAVTQTSGTGSANPGALVDPWGNGYYVRYDSGYTDAVKHPYSDGSTGADDPSGTTTGILRFGVIAWTYGKDSSVGKGVKPGLNGTTGTDPNYNYGDDIVSWQ